MSGFVPKLLGSASTALLCVCQSNEYDRLIGRLRDVALPDSRTSLEVIDAKQVDMKKAKIGFRSLLAWYGWVALLTAAVGCSPVVEEDSTRSGERTFDLESVLRDYEGVDLEVVDVSERSLDGRNVLAVTLSVPLDPANPFQSWFGVREIDGPAPDGAWVVSANGMVVRFLGSQPLTEYEVTVRAELTAANGSELKADYSQSVTTRGLRTTARFASDGIYLRDGTGLPIRAVNVERVHIDFYRLLDGEPQRSRFPESFELVHSAGFDIHAPENTWVQRRIQMDDIEVLEQPGWYRAIMTVTEPGTLEVSRTWISVTDIGLHLREYAGATVAFTHSLSTGEPLGDVTVEVGGDKVADGFATNSDGMAFLEQGLSGAKYVSARHEGQYSSIELRRPALDLSEFDIGGPSHAPITAFVYTPRDLFRPGEDIDFSALVRDGDGRSMQRPPAMDVSIHRPDGSIAKTFQWWPLERGYYQHRWRIPEDESLGTWTLRIGEPLGSPQEYRLRVEEFLPERLELKFDAASGGERLVAAPEDDLRFEVRGNHLYGAPAAGNVVEARLTVSPARHPLPSLPEYVFGPHDPGTDDTFRVNLDPIKLNEVGKGALTVSSRWQEVRVPMMARFHASLFESGGRPVTRSYAALVTPDAGMIGVRPGFGDSNPQAHSHVRFDIVNASADGELMEAAGLEVQLVKEDREYFWSYDRYSGWSYESTSGEYVAAERKLTVEAGQPGTLELPVETGHYRLEVSDPRDGRRTSLRFHAGEDWYARWEAARKGNIAPRPDKVTLTLDKPRYRAGDTARVHVLPPRAGNALILVEADRPLWSRQLQVPAEGAEIEIPVDDEWRRHDLYVSALVLHPDGGKPARSLGFVHLPLDRESRRLEVVIEAQPEALPMTRSEIRVRIHRNGVAAPGAHLTLAAVDMGVLNITDFETPDPHEGFFARRRYGVDARDMYEGLIEDIDAPAAKLRYGGDAINVTRGPRESDQRIVSLFSGPVRTDGEGRATVSFDLPDYDGRLRLMAVAFTDDAFGHAEQDMTVASPVIAELAMPRFLAPGDRGSVALDLFNQSGEPRSLSGELRVSQGGFMATSAPVPVQTLSEVTLADRERTVLRYPVQAEGHGEEMRFDLRLEGEGIDPILRSWTIPMRTAWPAVKQQRQGEVRPGEDFVAGATDIAGLLPETVKARIMLSPTPMIDLRRHFDELLQFPYGCLEQTASRTFPLVYATPDLQSQYGLQGMDEARRLEMIQAGLDRIATMQRHNGGFGLWSRKSDEEHWLTAFAADLLLDARDAGATVPDALVDSVMRRLTEYVNRDRPFREERWSEDPQHYNFAYKAYAAFVLARANQAPVGSLRTLFDHGSGRAKTGLPLLHLGAALLRMGDRERGAKAVDGGLKKLADGLGENRYLGDYGSYVRDLALGIHLLVTEADRQDSAAELAVTLADRLEERRWLSTQERNALFLAGIALESAAGQSWQAELVRDGMLATLDHAGRWSQPLSASELAAGLSVRSSTDRPVFAVLDIEGHTEQPPRSVAEGLSVERTWHDLDGQPVVPDRVQSGQAFIVKLTVKAEESTPDALLVDLLPAGFELENQNLPHAVDIEKYSVGGRSLGRWRREADVRHVEYRDDRFVAAFEAPASEESALFYIARAVTPGVYRVPPAAVEDMYRPDRRAIGQTRETIVVEAGEAFR